MLGGLIAWHSILRTFDVTCGIYLCAVIGQVYRNGEMNLVAIFSLAASALLISLGYRGIKGLYILGQVIYHYGSDLVTIKGIMGAFKTFLRI